ncbi:hypothetical protein J8273_6762 [Carpediemonas membranifera]|uniref:Uncharacterized protein n=1 Tax=Carpediemonas membranifera TaxID=201153 RepID=A0A8J6DYC1_9EUKA|nr:hypothetical protein J8273_6762 [Carpediemonas membranifera]|eukprot:KAG9391959.1 hypothetical protein J8273_6762 [Carpediemonas membranifera]
MDAVNTTATGVNAGTLAFSAPEEIAVRKAGKKLSHREQQAADVYHVGLTMLGAMAPDYFDFCRRLLSLITGDLVAASTVDDDALCIALLATVAVTDALREILSGMLATHPEVRCKMDLIDMGPDHAVGHPEALGQPADRSNASAECPSCLTDRTRVDSKGLHVSASEEGVEYNGVIAEPLRPCRLLGHRVQTPSAITKSIDGSRPDQHAIWGLR